MRAGGATATGNPVGAKVMVQLGGRQVEGLSKGPSDRERRTVIAEAVGAFGPAWPSLCREVTLQDLELSPKLIRALKAAKNNIETIRPDPEGRRLVYGLDAFYEVFVPTEATAMSNDPQRSRQIAGYVAVGSILPRVPLRQFVLAVPFELRVRFAHDGALLGLTNRTANR